MTDSQFEEIVERVYKFHTKRAPGIPIGVAMVQLAQEKLGKVDKLGAVAETQVCLSDAIQFLTGCTIGNKYLIMKDQIGRYALTLYDRTNGEGIRVFVDLEKIDEKTMPETRKFFLRLRDPELRKDNQARSASAKIIVKEFLDAGRDIFGWQKIKVRQYKKGPVYPVKICASCHESFIYQEDKESQCICCSGRADYYEKQ